MKLLKNIFLYTLVVICLSNNAYAKKTINYNINNTIVSSSELVFNIKNVLPAKKIKDNSKCHPTTFITWFDNCLFCHLFKTVFNAASKIAKTSYDAFAEPVVEVLWVASAIWIAFKILPFLASFKGGNVSEMVTDILKQMLLIFVIIVFLQTDGMGFFTYIMEPIFNTGFSIAKALLNTGTECQADYGILTGDDAGLPASMGNNIVCVIEQVQLSIASVLSIGMTSLCVACRIEYSLVQFVLPDFSYFLTGLLLLLGGTYLLIVFPFLVLDSVLQLTVAAGLLPFAMGCFPFKATKEYSMKVWQTFMTVVFNFVFLCLIMMICAKTIESMVSDDIISTLKDNLEGNLWTNIKESFGWETTFFFKILFMFILSYTMLQEVKNFTDQFSGGGGLNLGMASNIGTMMSSGLLNAGKKLTAGVSKQAAKGMKKGVGRAANGIGNLRTQKKSSNARKDVDAAFKGKSMANTVPSTTSTDLQRMQGELAELEAKKAAMSKGSPSPEAMNNINQMIEDKKQEVSAEKKALSTGAKQEVNVGNKTYVRYSDGRVEIKEKKGDEIITNEYGFDAKGRSIRNETKEDTKKAKALRVAMERSGGKGVVNDDGSTTYTYRDNSGRQMSVTESLDGKITRSHVNMRGQVVTEDITKDAKKVTSYTYAGKDTKIYDNTGKARYDSDNYKSGLKNIIKGDGTLNQNEIDKLKSEQKYLEEQIANEKDAVKIKGLEVMLKKEKQRTDKIIGEAILAKTFNEKHYKRGDTCVKREVIPASEENGNTITIKEYKADGTVKTYNMKMDAKKPPMVEMETQDPEGNKATLKTDGVLQMRTFEDKDGNKKAHFAINSDILDGVYDKQTAERKINKILENSEFSPEEKSQAVDYIKNYIESGGRNKPIKAFG